MHSYAAPGGNVTGPALFNGMELTTKRIEFLRDVAPNAKRLAWVWPQDFYELPTLSGASNDLRPAISLASRASGFDVTFFSSRTPSDVPVVLDAVAKSGAQAIAGGVAGRPEPMTEFALRHRLPSAFPMRYFVEAGGLISYGPLEADVQRTMERAAVYVDRILRGARAAELAIEQPSRYELALNAKTAIGIGISLPRALMLRADAVIS